MATSSLWYPGDFLVAWGVNVLLQATLVAAASLLVAKLAPRSPAVRSRILCSAVLLLLAIPAITFVMQVSERCLISFPLSPRSVTTAITDLRTAAAARGANDESTELAGISALRPSENDRSPTISRDRAQDSLPAGDEFQDSPAASMVSDRSSSVSSSSATPLDSQANKVAATSNYLANILWSAIPLIMLAWAIGALFFLARLVWGWWRLYLIVRTAYPVASPRVLVAADAACRIVGAAKPPACKLSPHMPGPIAVGLWNPCIVLPMGSLDRVTPQQLTDVLVHEMAHIRRHDPLIVLLQNLAGAVYWLHPLVRGVNRELAIAREEICDNHVLAATDAPSYSRTLLTLGELLSKSTPLPNTVGLFTSSWILEDRIAGLLDVQRNRQTGLDKRGRALAMLFPIMFAGLAAAGTIQIAGAPANPSEFRESVDPAETPRQRIVDGVPASRSQLAQTAKPAPVTQKPGTASAAAAQPATVTPAQPIAGIAIAANYSFSGSLVDDQGRPVAGARVSLSYLRNRTSRDPVPPSTVSDNEGQFKLDYAGDLISDASVRDASLIGLMAEKPGYGLAYGAAGRFDKSGRIASTTVPAAAGAPPRQAGERTDVLILVRDDLPLRGRVVTTEGRPVVGAYVEVLAIYEGMDGTLKSWEAAMRSGIPNENWRQLRTVYEKYLRANGRAYVNGKRVFASEHFQAGFRVPAATIGATDADGRFELTGIGRDRIVELGISAPGIETSLIFSRTQAGELLKPSGLSMELHYPTDFSFVASPSIPAQGRVIDRESKEPLAGVRIYPLGSLFVRAVTDAMGRYRLEGLPVGDNRMYVTPPPGSRHVAGGILVRTEAGAEVVEREVSLSAGVFVRGQVIDRRTGVPAAGHMTYFAYEDNPYLEGSDSLREHLEHTFQTDSEGRFDVPVLPGKGILAFVGGPQFQYGLGAEKINAPRFSRAGPGSIVFQAVPNQCSATSYNVMLPLNPGQSEKELTANLSVQSATEVAGRITRGDGSALGETYILGANQLGWQRLAGATFHVVGYFPTETRRLLVYCPDGNLVGRYDLTGPPPEMLEIMVKPGATIAGRVTGSNGYPVANAEITGVLPTGNPRSGIPSDHGLVPPRTVYTDADGYFRLDGIVPGLKYAARAGGITTLGNEKMLAPLGRIFEDVVAEAPGYVQLGDLIPYMGTPPGKAKASAEKPKAAPQNDPFGPAKG